MDVERALVSRIARSQSMGEAVRLESHNFLQRKKGDESPVPMPGEVYAWMVSHWRRYRVVPSVELTYARFPKFEFLDSTDPIDALVDQMVKVVKRRALIQGIRQLSEVADDPERVGDAEVHAFEIAAEIARSVPDSVITKLSDSLSRYDLYLERERTGVVPGMSMAIDWLDDITYGLQDYELMIWQGFLGGGKSSLTIAQAAKAYLERDETGLFFALEMQGDKLASKWDAMMSGFSYNALKKTKLDDVDKAKWEAFGEKAESSRFERDILVLDDIQRCTSDRIHAEIQRWRPDYSVVDTIDEVRAPSHMRDLWQQQAYAVRELKGICRAVKKPMIGVAQAGRDAEMEGAKLGNIAGSIDIARKADIVVGLHATPQMKRAHQMEIRLLKSRDSEGDGASTTIFADIANMNFRPWTPADSVPAKT